MSSGETPGEPSGQQGASEEGPAGPGYQPSVYRPPNYQPLPYQAPAHLPAAPEPTDTAPTAAESRAAEPSVAEPAVPESLIAELNIPGPQVVEGGVTEESYRSAPPPLADRRVETQAKPWNPPVRRRGPRRIGCLVVGALVLFGGASGFVYRMLNRPAPVASSGGSSSPRTPYTPPPRVVVPPFVAGWQSVVGGQGAYAYDVPPSWVPEPSTPHGWEADSTGPETDLSTSAFYLDGFCAGQPNSKRGGSGVTTAKIADPASAATQVATEVALHRYTDDNGPRPTLSVGAPQPAEVSFGAGRKSPASITMIDVTSVSTGPCASPHALVGAIALTSSKDQQSVVLVAYADQSIAQPTTAEELQQILRSYRLVPAADRTTLPATPTPTTPHP